MTVDEIDLKLKWGSVNVLRVSLSTVTWLTAAVA